MKKIPSESEIKALVNLLDDPDEEVYATISAQLMDWGEEIIPALEHAWENTFNHNVQQKIEDIIQQIQFQMVVESLRIWACTGGIDLLEGAIAVARYQYPDLDEIQVRQQLDIIRKDIWLELNSNLTALEKVKVINHIFFDVHGFSGNTTHYHAPQNSYVHLALETKKGNPLMLSLLYICLAQGLNIPIYGVNLPEHFILAYVDELHPKDNPNDPDPVLFYINAFSKGSVFSRREIDQFLQQLKLKPNASYYMPCSNLNIIIRLVRNLINSYEKMAYPAKVKDLQRLLALLEQSASN